MSQTINVNGESINYPETGDTNWGDEATEFAIQTSAALGKIGLASGTTVDITSTLDVTGATTLDSTLTVAGTTTLNGTANLNGNNNLGNASSDTTAITGILNVDSGVLYVDPTTNKVGINDTTPSVELDVNGAVAISGTLGVTGDVAVNTNKFNVTASSGNTTIAGTLGIANGTASNPSLIPSGDTNTGLYSIGSDKLGFAANGARIGEFGVGYGGFTGNIIQVLSTAKTDTATFSTSFGTISGLSQSITPKYSTSKILIIINISFGRSLDNLLYFKILRDASDIYIGDVSSTRTRSSSSDYASGTATGTQSGNMTLVFLDSPSTVSSITYDTQARSDAGSGFINRTGTDTDSATFSRMASSITVMELQQ